MEEAVAAIEKGMPVRRAAEMYSVPKSTFHDRISGRVKNGAKPGPPQYLTTGEEEELASFLLEASRIGYPHTKKQVLAIVQQIVEDKGITANVTEGWWQRFHGRHPRLTMKSAVPLSYVRAQAHDEDVLRCYYDMLHECMTTNDIMNKPSAIFNCDETGLPLNPKCHKVVSEVASNHTSHITGNQKGQTTVLACTCAAGYALQPLVIFNRKTLNAKATEGEVPGTFYGLSSSAKNRVLLFALPPNTTHLTQPLDRACFAPLKAAWRYECHQFYTSHPGRVVTHLDFCELFSKAWYQAMIPRNITASYKVTGICPCNPSSIQLGGTEKKSFSTFNPASLVEESGLKYIPFYSPTSKGRDISNRVACEENDDNCWNSDSDTDCDLSLESSSVDNSPPKMATLAVHNLTSVSKFLVQPLPPSAHPTKRTKSCGMVLTSAQNMKLLEEKQRVKDEKERKKNEKKKKQDEKKL